MEKQNTLDSDLNERRLPEAKRKQKTGSRFFLGDCDVGLVLDCFKIIVVDTEMRLSGIFQRVLDATEICGKFIVVAVWLFIRRGRDHR